MRLVGLHSAGRYSQDLNLIESNTYADYPDQPNPYGLDLATVRRIEPPPGAFLTCWGTFARLFGPWEVDASIFDHISAYNDTGFTTDQSDSGVLADHPLATQAGQFPVGPYVTFRLDIGETKLGEVRRAAGAVGADTGVGQSYGRDVLWVRLGRPGDDGLVRWWAAFTDALVGGPRTARPDRRARVTPGISVKY